MSAQWHYELFGEEFGPVGEDTLRDLIANGTLSDDDRVRNQGGPWLSAGQALLMANLSATATAVAPEPEPEEDPAHTDDIPEWYCQVLGQELGPLTFNELLNFAQSGELSADDQVRMGASGKWRRVGSMGRLVAVLPYQNSSVTRVGKKKPATQTQAPVETPTPPPPVKPAAPQITYAPAASEPTWFAWIRGMEYGPLSLLQLQQYLGSGQLSATDFVKFGMTGAWCPPATVTQMLAQYTIAIPPTVSRTPTPPKAMPTVTAAPSVKKPSVENVATVAAAKPVTTASKTDITPPVTKPAPVEPVAKVEPPRPEPVAAPAAEPVTRPASSTSSSAASTNTYGGSSSNWQAKTVTAPPKPAARPAHSSGGGTSFDFSAITSMINAKSLGVGGGLIAAAALVFAFLYMPAGSGAEAAAFKELHPLYEEFQKIRESKAGAAELSALEGKIKKVCPPIVKTMEPRASASRPVSQKLLWVAKYRMNEMVAKGASGRSQSEIDCERMLYEVSQALKLPMDAPKPVEVAAPKAGSPTPPKGPMAPGNTLD